MDDFVRGKLIELGLEKFISNFEENEINKNNLICLEEHDFKTLIPAIGPRARFRAFVSELKDDNGQISHTSSNCSVTPSTNAMDSSRATPSTSTMGRSRATPSTSTMGRSRATPSTSTMGRSRATPRTVAMGSSSVMPGRDPKLKKIKEIMGRVKEKLPDDDYNGLIAFLRELIDNLDTDKKELVGVFGKTGAGKSSLINAVIREKDLLPTGDGRACTSVIIKVEANTENQKYMASVEFITKEELDDLLWSTRHLFGNSSGKNKVDKENKDNYEKMKALFGNDWYKDPYEKCMKSEKYKKISKAITQRKELLGDSASALVKKLKNYTQNDRESRPLFWPVVKCVTIKVPNCDVLRHATLVDLPGTGDRNKTRNDMWKEMVSSCGTVWIVTDLIRPESEKEPWEILESACSLLGNGGVCRNIHFICTKADQCLDKLSPEHVIYVKNNISKDFQELPEVERHLPDDCFEVFIVSATDEMPEEKNEIDYLMNFLQTPNDQRDREQRYLPDAFGILSLMKGARSQNTQQKTAVYTDLCARRTDELNKLKSKMTSVYERFEERLTEGVNTAKKEWESALDKKIGPINSYTQLKSILDNDGVQSTKTGDHINLNTTLSSFLTNSIDRQFKETFPNAGKDKPFNGAIHDFSLDSERLIESHKDVELLLKFLKSEEDKLKVQLCEEIRERKKRIYNSLTETVMSEMLPAYREAKAETGDGALKRMKITLKNHIQASDMFDKVKREMLEQLQTLTRDIIKHIDDRLMKAMDMSLKRDITSVPDVTKEYNDVKKVYIEEAFNH